MSESNSEPRGDDVIGRLIRTSGRGPTPPSGARERVYAAVHAEWRRNVQAAAPAARKRTRGTFVDWLGFVLKPGLAVAAAVGLAIGVGSFIGQSPDIAPVELASLGRTIGEVTVIAPGDAGVARATAGIAIVAGTRLRTAADGGAALVLAGGESLRMDAGSELVLASQGRVELAAGAVYLDSEFAPVGAGAVVVVTPYGDVRHIGTQYEVRISDENLRVRVREGAVAIAAGDAEIVGSAGEQVVVPGDGDVVTTTFAPTDPAWQWTESLAALPEAGAYPLTDVLEWVARQTGRDVEFGSPGSEQRAGLLELNGLGGLTPGEVIEVVRSTTDLDYRTTATSIVVD